MRPPSADLCRSLHHVSPLRPTFRPRSCTNCVLPCREICTVTPVQQLCQPSNVGAPREDLVEIRCRPRLARVTTPTYASFGARLQPFVRLRLPLPPALVDLRGGPPIARSLL